MTARHQFLQLVVGIDGFITDTQIKVIGVGDAGCNAVAYMMSSGIKGVEFLCANSDAQELTRSLVPTTILLCTVGPIKADKLKKRHAAAEGEEEFRAALEGAHMLFIAAGMGGRGGSNAASVIARIAKDMGILTVGVLTLPFEFEGDRRRDAALAGLNELQVHLDSVIVVHGDKLLKGLGDDVSLEAAFVNAADLLKNLVGGIAETINVPGHINADFEDVRAIMSEPGKTVMGSAVASGPERARMAVEQAVAHPLLEGVDLSGAKGAIVLITAAKSSMKLSETKQVMNIVRACISPEAHVIYGTAHDESLADEIRVTVVATGLNFEA